MRRTPWFTARQAPTRPGMYEVQYRWFSTKDGSRQQDTYLTEWTGTHWRRPPEEVSFARFCTPFWRGLIDNPHMEKK